MVLVAGWVVWAIVAVGLALGELATPGLFFPGIVALAGGAAWLQLLVFIAGSLASLGILRPIARAHLRVPALTRTGTARLIGARAVVVQRVVALFVLVVLARTVRIVPQARAGVVERLGRYSRTLNPGLAIVVPFVDRVRTMVDLREQVVSFQPQPVITEDNLVVNIDTVLYFQITEPKAATYEIANYVQGIEQLTVTTLRNVIGGLALEETLTSRDNINAQLRGVLDEATGKWGIRVNRVELKAIDPPATIK